jgi:hypothetical protein
VVFQLDQEDAKALERRYLPSLTADDLMGLRQYEVAARLCVDGQTRAPVTGSTLSLDEPVRDAIALVQASRERYGTARAQVEAALRARVAANTSAGRIGRRQEDRA